MKFAYIIIFEFFFQKEQNGKTRIVFLIIEIVLFFNRRCRRLFFVLLFSFQIQ